jgi:SET domain-containing protein
MFVVKTRVAPSAIHGLGVFACEDISAGAEVWRFQPPFDIVVPESALADLPAAVRMHLDIYGYRSVDLGGQLVLSGDNAKYLNHSDDPSLEESPFRSVARRPIAEGEEITCDYGAFCTDWDGGFGADGYPSGPPSPPHANLYTRLQGSKRGVGLFALRDIPAGTTLFLGDKGETVRVSPAVVDAIDDDEIKKMYYDFCPLVDGAFVAPADFNQMTMGWYMNHSDSPNVVVREGTSCLAGRLIAKGEELTTDYRTYSEHAEKFVRLWSSS